MHLDFEIIYPQTVIENELYLYQNPERKKMILVTNINKNKSMGECIFGPDLKRHPSAILPH